MLATSYWVFSSPPESEANVLSPMRVHFPGTEIPIHSLLRKFQAICSKISLRHRPPWGRAWEAPAATSNVPKGVNYYSRLYLGSAVNLNAWMFESCVRVSVCVCAWMLESYVCVCVCLDVRKWVCVCVCVCVGYVCSPDSSIRELENIMAVCLIEHQSAVPW